MDLSEKLIEVRDIIDRATGRINDDLDKLSHAAAEIQDLAASQACKNGVQLAVVRRATDSAEVRALVEAANQGALALTMESACDGSAEVRINGGASFRVRPTPATLLRILASPGGRDAGDGLLGWRTYAEVGKALAKATGRPVSRHNLVNTIHRLRKTFRGKGQNWFLIKTDRRGNVRFALRTAVLQ